MRFILHHYIIQWHILVNIYDLEQKIIGCRKSDEDLMVTAAKNPDGSIAVIVFNEEKKLKTLHLALGDKATKYYNKCASNTNYNYTTN